MIEIKTIKTIILITDWLQTLYYNCEKNMTKCFSSGTICYDFSDGANYTFCIFNLSENKNYLFWLSMCYLKFDESREAHVKDAKEYLKGFDNQALVAKMLLEVIC